MSEREPRKIIINDVEYEFEKLTPEAKSQLANIKFVDEQIQQLNNEWAVADTAKIGYLNALKREISKLENNA